MLGNAVYDHIEHHSRVPIPISAADHAVEAEQTIEQRLHQAWLSGHIQGFREGFAAYMAGRWNE